MVHLVDLVVEEDGVPLEVLLIKVQWVEQLVMEILVVVDMMVQVMDSKVVEVAELVALDQLMVVLVVLLLDFLDLM